MNDYLNIEQCPTIRQIRQQERDRKYNAKVIMEMKEAQIRKLKEERKRIKEEMTKELDRKVKILFDEGLSACKIELKLLDYDLHQINSSIKRQGLTRKNKA